MCAVLNFENLFLLFRKTSETEKFLAEEKEREKDATDFAHVRCPLCRWQPTASSLWFCSDWGDPEYFFGGCGTAWNTFETNGRCPGCSHQWKYTSCLRCARWSPHEAWYENKENF